MSRKLLIINTIAILIMLSFGVYEYYYAEYTHWAVWNFASAAFCAGIIFGIFGTSKGKVR